MGFLVIGRVIGLGLERERGSLKKREDEKRRGEVEEEEATKVVVVVVMARLKHLFRTILLVRDEFSYVLSRLSSQDWLIPVTLKFFRPSFN